MANRNDYTSISFGARLSRAERDAAQAKAELSELKQALPNSKDLQAAAMTADVIKQQRRSAKQMMSRADATLEELNSIDPSVLTPQFQEQLRLSKTDAAWRELPMEQQGFQFQTPQAEARFRSWSSALPQQDFTANNVLPGEAKPQRAFDIWSARQDSPEGRYQRNKKNQQQLNRDVMLRRAEAARNKPKSDERSGGIHLGGMRPLD
jgi:hypothetical protein